MKKKLEIANQLCDGRDMKEPTFSDYDSIDDETTEGISADEYTAMWGCDSSYDRSPNLRGDGALFYNYSTEKDAPGFMGRFIPAVERTIASVKLHLEAKDGCHDPSDIVQLDRLLQYCQIRAAEMSTFSH